MFDETKVKLSEDEEIPDTLKITDTPVLVMKLKTYSDVLDFGCAPFHYVTFMKKHSLYTITHFDSGAKVSCLKLLIL